MKILDRYILREMLGPFIFGVVAFSSIFIGSDVLFKLARFYIRDGVPINILVRLFFLSIPEIVVLTFPMSMLLSSLLGFGRLSGNSEVVAMKAGGISFLRMVVPVLLLAFVVSGLTFLLNEEIVPLAQERYQNILAVEVQKEQKPKNQENIVIRNMEDGKLRSLFYAQSYDSEKEVMNRVTVQEFSDIGKANKMITAEKGIWRDNSWTFLDGAMYVLNEQGNVEYDMKFKEEKLNLAVKPKEILGQQKDPDEMSAKELIQRIAVLKMQKVDSRVYEVNLHRHFSIPFACFVFTLIGAPLGLKPNRSGSSVGLGLSIIIIFIYYVVMMVSGALGEGGALLPWLSAWLPNIFLGLSGIYLMRKASL
ncbi:MAG: LPS export ABC transporter permease LptG [bacterium]